MRLNGNLEASTWTRTISHLSFFLLAISFIRFLFTRLFNINELGELETLDKLVWLSILGYTVAQFLLQSRNGSNFNSVNRLNTGRTSQTDTLYPIVASLILFASSILMAPIPGIETLYWYGFGLKQGFAAIVLIIVVYHLQRRVSHNKFIGGKSLRTALHLMLILQVIWYLPLLISPVWGLMDGAHSIYSMNDVVAPANGSIPLVDYAAQYSSLLGFPIRPLANVVSTNFPIVTTLYLSFLTILTFLILIISCKKAISHRSGWLCIVIIIPITLTTAPSPNDNTAITSMFSAVPLRLLPIVVIGAMLISLTSQHKKQHLRAFFLGMILVAAVFNNFEFGIPAALSAALFSIIILRERKINLLFIVAGSLTSALILYLVLDYQFPKFAIWSLFTLAFGQGFGAAPMPIFGLFVLVLVLLSSGAIVGTYAAMSKVSTLNLRRSVLVGYYGIAGLGSFGYYIGRSMVPTQLQIFFIFCAPILVVMVDALVNEWKDTGRGSRRLFISNAPIVYLFAFSMSSIMQGPNLSDQLHRLVPKDGYLQRDSWPLNGETIGLMKDLNFIEERDGSKPLLLALGGQYQAQQIKAVSVNPYSSPADYMLSKKHQSLLCEKLSNANETILISVNIVTAVGAAMEACNMSGNMEALPSSNVLLTISD